MSVLDRITADPAIFGRKPIIRGMRISVGLSLSQLAQGERKANAIRHAPSGSVNRSSFIFA